MNKTPWYTRLGILIFWLMAAALTVFFVYMASSGAAAVHKSDPPRNYSVLTDPEAELITTKDAPVQVQKIYRWTPESESSRDDCLFIYFSHHDLQVYFDDVLAFSLSAGENNRTNSSAGSNWCAVHVGQNPTGTQITLVMTPLFEAAANKSPEIYFGAHYSIAMDLLRNEFPLMVFSALCFFLGLVLVAVSLYFHFAMKISGNHMIFLGLFAIFLGLWKITDLASLSMLLPEDSMAIGCIRVASLFLSGPCLMLYCTTLFTEKGRLPMILLAGIMLDLLFFFRSSTGLFSFTIGGLMIYTLIVFTGSIRNAARKAYTDVCTGLVNRIRWNEMMSSDTAIADPYCFMMIDLNGLKRVNDTLGHEAGDQMIFRLASLLRSTLPRSSMICRWGGDEFAVLLYDVTRPMLDRHIEDLFAAGDKYNRSHPELPIHFSLGAVLSTDHPSLSKTDLFRLADEEMYHDKQSWYTRQ